MVKIEFEFILKKSINNLIFSNYFFVITSRLVTLGLKYFM